MLLEQERVPAVDVDGGSLPGYGRLGAFRMVFAIVLQPGITPVELLSTAWLLARDQPLTTLVTVLTPDMSSAATLSVWSREPRRAGGMKTVKTVAF